MDESDKKVRKRWLMVWILSTLVGFIPFPFLFQYDPAWSQLPPSFRYGIVGFSVFSFSLFAACIYHCVYRRPGTKLLTLIIALTVTNLVMTPFLYWKGMIQPLTFIPYYWVYTSLHQLLVIWWVALSWKMRKVNQKIRSLGTVAKSS